MCFNSKLFHFVSSSVLLYRKCIYGTTSSISDGLNNQVVKVQEFSQTERMKVQR